MFFANSNYTLIKLAKLVKLSLVPVLMVSLSACFSGSGSDLDEWVREVESRKGGRIEPLPEIKPYADYVYAGSGQKDPFQPFFQQREAEKQDGAAEVGLTDEMKRELSDRNREELEQFELDSLRMVGTLQNPDENWAVISDPDGVIHRVRVGNYLGRNIGKIINIYEDRVELREVVKNNSNRWEERQAALALIEE